MHQFCVTSCNVKGRDNFSERHQIGEPTLRSWELDISNISERLLKQLLAAFEKENIVCSHEWLLHGRQPSPLIIPFNNIPGVKKSPRASNQETIQTEINVFLGGTDSRIIAKIVDGCNAPYLASGDIVGGEVIPLKDIKKHQGKLCIINHPEEDNTLIVRIVNTSQDGDFALHSWNINAKKSDKPILYTKELELCAPVIWHRKVYD